MTDLNDSLADLLGGEMTETRTEPVRNVPAYKPMERRFEEGCDKCKGTGRFVSWSGRILGECFACKGQGKKVFKTSATARANNRERSAERKAKTWADSVETFKAVNPEVWLWLEKETQKQEPFAFAVGMVEAIAKYGDLTDKQLETCKRLAAKAAERIAGLTARAADAPAVDSAGIDRLKASFDQAIAYSAAKGLKLSPRITIDGMTISPAKANSANPGALYVKAGQTYLGKVANGRFFASAEGKAMNVETKVQAFIADPQEAAKVYGQTTGTCCICNATLRSDWKHKGIGPICAEKFGW